MAEKIHLTIVTPYRKLWDAGADMVLLKAADGYLGVLRGHIPLVVELDYGFIKIKDDDTESVATVLGGFAEITGKKVTVITDAAEWPDEIDHEPAEEARVRAEETMNTASGSELIRAEVALRKAMLRLEASRNSE